MWGPYTGANSGRSLSGAGDINGDGYADVIIGARGATPGGVSSVGESYVVLCASQLSPLGSGLPSALPSSRPSVPTRQPTISPSAPSVEPSSVPSFRPTAPLECGTNGVFELSSINGVNGFTVSGRATSQRLGYSVSSAGDMNGDGIDDIAIASDWSPREVLVIYGGSGESYPTKSSDLDGNNGFVITNSASYSDHVVAPAGDVNGDGFDDILIGEESADPNSLTDAGIAYVVYGKATMASSLSLTGLDGTNGFSIEGFNPYSKVGFSVAVAGDVNKDGCSDLIIGAGASDLNGYYNSAASFVIYGGHNLSHPFVLNLINGTNGFQIEEVDDSACCGHSSSVSPAGDVNGDGFDDIIIGSRSADPNGLTNAGESYVIYGGKNLPHPFYLAHLNGTNGFAVEGVAEYDQSGYAVSNAGDVNGDGYADVIIGAPDSDLNGEQSGCSYIIYGGVNITHPFELSSLNGQNGIRWTVLICMTKVGHQCPTREILMGMAWGISSLEPLRRIQMGCPVLGKAILCMAAALLLTHYCFQV